MQPPSTWPPANAENPLAVLVSGGLDSAILLGEALRVYPRVHPLYILTGAVWEELENRYLRRFLNAIRTPRLAPLAELALPVEDLYGEHWSLSGKNIPGADTPDVAVFLPGRNVILLSKALIWCHLHGVPELATAPLGSNPFPDATPAFFDDFAEIVSSAVAGLVRVLRPYAALNLNKVDVLKRGIGMPLELTLSCIRPVRGMHCGACNKCAERRNGFREAKLMDPTEYAE